MGFRFRPTLFAAPLLLAAPVHAQQTEAPATGLQLPPATSRPAPNPSQQGPELDVFRDPVTPRATPPVVAPTVIPPPATVQPVPTPQPTRPRATPMPAPVESRTSRPVERPATAPAPTARSRPTRPAPAAEEPAPTPVAADNAAENSSTATPPPAQPVPPQSLPAPAANAAATPEAEEEDGLSLPWMIGGALALLIVAAALLLRRRRANAPQEAQAALPKPRKTAPKAAATPPAPETPAAPELVAPRPAPVASDSGRPWLDMDMAIAQARYSMIGVTINYALILHNRGDRPAEDVLVRGILGNGGAQQQAVLRGFFTGQDGLPLHNAVSIAPGETVQLTGELRLSSDQIVPVEMGQRSLLIPLAAFDASYRWGADGSEMEASEMQGREIEGSGRTARAFIVGQEQEPPAERLAPLRLDQGPRQYRRPAARAAAELTPS